MTRDSLLRRAEKARAEAAILKEQATALREERRLWQLERDLNSTVNKLSRVLKRYGVRLPPEP